MDTVTAVKATYEVIGQDISDLAIRTIVTDLGKYPVEDVAIALNRCRRELKRITLADIINRIPGGYLRPEAAWALVSRVMGNEQASVVWTDEMAQAYGVARLLGNDKIAALMAFLETYATLINEARSKNLKPRWWPSPGYDQGGRQAAVEEAVALGRLTEPQAIEYLPDYDSVHPTIRLPTMGTMPSSETTVSRSESSTPKDQEYAALMK